MKNCINVLYAALLITIVGLSGCENPVNHTQTPDRSGNRGYVAVRIETPHTSMARTIYPELSGFTKYELSFSNGPEAHAAVVVNNPDVASPIELAVGEWTITATAFTGIAGNTPAARGSVTITVNPGQTTETDVNLAPITGDAGTFSYTIAVPSGASGNLVITTPEGAAVSGGNISLPTDSTTSGSINLPTGQYLISANLTLGEKRAGWTEVLHIYPHMTSRVEYQFFPYDFQLVNVLSPNEWTEGTLSSGEVHWYKFATSAGDQIQWNDYYGDGTKTLAASVSAYTSDGSVIFENQTSGWTSPKTVSDPAGTVYLRVQGASGNNDGTYAIKYYDPDSLPPQAGLALSINALPVPLAVVSWNSVPGATGYRLYRTTSPNGDYTTIEPQTGVTYMDTTVLAGISYYYKVCAYNENGDGPMSPVASVVIPAATTLSINTWVNGTISNGGEIQWYTFTASAGATYQVQWNDLDGDGTKTLSASVSAYKSNGDVIFLNETSGWTNPPTVSGLTGTVYLKVQGASGNDTGGYALKYYIDPSTIPPEAPGAPTINLGSEQLTVSWTAVLGASAYEVWMGTSNDSTQATKRGNDIIGLSTIISGLTNNTVYYVWMKAKNNAGTSDFSPMASGKPLETPGNLTVSAANAQLTVSWAVAAGADSYDVYYGTSTTPPSAAQQSGIAGTSTTITELSNGTTYYVWVKAKNATGMSDFSSRSSGKPLGTMGTITIIAKDGQLTVSWDAVAGADEYELYYDTSDTQPTTSPEIVTNTVVDIDGLTNDITYYIWVKAKNAYGTSSSSMSSGTPMPEWGLSSGNTFVGYKNLAESVAWLASNATANGVYTIVLNEDESVGPISLSYSGNNVSVTLRGCLTNRIISLNTNGALFTIGSGVTLTLDTDITLQGRTANTNSLVSVGAGGAFVMEDGSKVSDNSCASSSYGGGVYNSGGTFTMNGGEISGNSAPAGGGVYMSNSGTFTMSGGEISSNSAFSYGGGVYIFSSGGTFTMNGGEISGNSATGSAASVGGGVSSSGTFTMNGGEIYSNSSTRGGGVSNSGTFTMNGGEIYSNSAPVYGGGVYNNSGTFTMSSGEIADNSSSEGGGVFIYIGTFTMSGGEIAGNSASSYGGGVYTSSGTFKKTGGIIYGDTNTIHTAGSTENTVTSGNGHAVYAYSAKIRNSTAGTDVALDSAVAGSAGGWE